MFIGDIDGIINPPVSSQNIHELEYYNLESVKYALHWWLQKKVANPAKAVEFLENAFATFLSVNKIQRVE